MKTHRRWTILLATGSGLVLVLILAWVFQVMAAERQVIQTTLEDFNAGTLYHTALTRQDNGEVRLMVVGIAGEWITDTNSIPLPGVMGHCAVEHNERIYVVGGKSTDAPYDDRIWMSTINSTTHDLSDWMQIANLDPIHPNGVWKQSCVVLNSRLYILGGLYGTPGTAYDTVFFADINADGSLGSWQTTTSLPEPRYGAEAAVLNDRIYVLGGVYGGIPRSQAWFADLDPGSGAVTTWYTTTAMPEVGYYGHGVATGDGRIYVTGGTDDILGNGTFFPYVDMATPGASGTITEWVRTTNTEYNLFAHKALLLNGQIFVLGGAINNALFPSAYVGAALLDPDGTIPFNWTDASVLEPERYWHAAVASIDSWIYVIGGSDGGINPITLGIINRGSTTGETGYAFAPIGTFTSDEIELDPQYDRVITGLSWSSHISDTSELSITMEYRFRAIGQPWSNWRGPYPSDPASGFVTTFITIDNAIGNRFQYQATLSHSHLISATPSLNAVIVHYDVPEPPLLKKSASPPHDSLVEAGSPISYTVRYTNTSFTPLSNVAITDNIPSSTTLIVGSLDPPGNVGPNWVSWSVGSVLPGESGEVSFAVLVDDQAPDGTIIYNQARIHSTETGTGFSNLVRHIVGEYLYDLQVFKDNGTDVVSPGQILTYTISFTNSNVYSLTIGGLVFTETIDPHTYLSFIGDDTVWTEIAPGVFSADGGELAAGESGNLEFVMQISSTIPMSFDSITNTVLIGDDGAIGSEMDTSNNQAQDVDTLIPLSYDLMVIKDDGTFTAEPGQILTYTITFSNQNSLQVPLVGVVLTETLDPSAYMTYLRGDLWNEIAPGSYRYEAGTLPEGVPSSVTFVVSVSHNLPISTMLGITNIVQIADAGIQGEDYDLENNTFLDIDIVSGPDLAVTDLSISPYHPVISEPLTINVTVQNRGIDGTGAGGTDAYFYVEVYAKDADFVPAGPPDGPMDHLGGLCADAPWPGCTIRWEYFTVDPIPGLDPGEEVDIAFTITPTLASTYTLYAQADVTFDIPQEPWGHPWGIQREGNELNNIAVLPGIIIRSEKIGGIYLPLVLRGR